MLALLLGGFRLQAQEADREQVSRIVVRSLMAGGGWANVLDTYLSPLEYTGGGARIVFESMQNTRWRQGRWKVQHQVQLQYAYTKNPSGSADMHAGLLTYSYALLYKFPMAGRLQVLAGPMLDVNGGVVYNQRNSNNPAQAKAYGGLGASGMLAYRFHIGRYPLLLRYQAQLPLLGVMFSPEYGASYYDMFSLGHGSGSVRFTSLHNHPSLRQLLTLDMPIGTGILRVGYLCDLQQAKVNGLKTHHYSHDFLLGFVRHLYLLKGKRHFNLDAKDHPF